MLFRSLSEIMPESMTTSSEITSETTTEQTTHEKEVNSPGDIEICDDYYNPDSERIVALPKADLGTLADDEDLAKLKEFKNLKSLCTILGNDQYKYLLDLPQLQELDIDNTLINENFIEVFNTLKNLETIRVSICTIESKNLEYFTKCNSVKKLSIYGAEINDISSVSELQNLEYISLAIGTEFCFEPLYSLSNLKELWVPEWISKDELSKLKEVLPNCKIETTAY